ncbi:hypothetical protein HBI67_123680 [Parastagonospora nodorum]|nr:hypothetical protein HBI12_017290 [Parastagonospora nodorum]KAH6059919.1 hypothetical protein HBI66_203250 [Parastagonospora nodorum]KAH6065095.1 hypothetical protein HBI67_123680 [Parastagonospora nodorum]
MTSEETPSEIEAVIHECPYCPETLYTFDTGDYDVDESYEYFHKPCVSALCTEFEHLKSALCDQCLHLRLWHLLKCMQWGPGNDAFEVNLDRPFRRVQFMSKTCPFCQLIQTLLLPGTYDPAKLESGDPLFMDVDEDACLQLSLAKLSEQKSSTVATVFVDSGASIFRTPTIGALHIALTGQAAFKTLVGSTVEWNRIREVIKTCRRDHVECQKPVSHHLPKGFRVIDVTNRCIVEKEKCDFVALSYVWGADATMITYTNNIEERRRHGICLQLNERYLWIDRLCIIQDDEEDKARQIRSMDIVYSAARFVIMNTYGNGATYGIPGVSRSRHAMQSSALVPGMTVTNQVRETGNDSFDTWLTRGWTYQEAVLAQRKLYFRNRSIYYECEEGILHEDAFNDDATLRYRDLRLHFQRYSLQRYNSGFTAYTRHVNHYSTRALTFRGDVYSAFSGVMNTLFGTAAVYYGLSLAHFDQSLHWFRVVNDKPLIREEQGTHFPSWSWYSYMCTTDPIRHQQNSYHGPLTAWYTYNAVTGGVFALNEQVDGELERDWRLLMSLIYSEAGIAYDWRVSLQDETWNDIHQAATKRWPDYSEFHKQLPGVADDLQLIAHQEGRKTPGTIVGRTQTAFFRLDSKDQWANILNAQGTLVGQMYGATPRIARRVDSSLNTNSQQLCNLEFMALSVFGKDRASTLVSVWMTRRYADANGEKLHTVPMVQVMLIAWNGHVAHREGLAWVYLADWAAATRKWKTIILQ